MKSKIIILSCVFIFIASLVFFSLEKSLNGNVYYYAEDISVSKLPSYDMHSANRSKNRVINMSQKEKLPFTTSGSERKSILSKRKSRIHESNHQEIQMEENSSPVFRKNPESLSSGSQQGGIFVSNIRSTSVSAVEAVSYGFMALNHSKSFFSPFQASGDNAVSMSNGVPDPGGDDVEFLSIPEGLFFLLLLSLSYLVYKKVF